MRQRLEEIDWDIRCYTHPHKQVFAMGSVKILEADIERSWAQNHGWVLFEELAGQPPLLEWWDGVQHDQPPLPHWGLGAQHNPEILEQTTHVYNIQLFAQPVWEDTFWLTKSDLGHIAAGLDMNLMELWRLGKSACPIERARAMLVMIDHEGGHEFDWEPMYFTEAQLHQRWPQFGNGREQHGA